MISPCDHGRGGAHRFLGGADELERLDEDGVEAVRGDPGVEHLAPIEACITSPCARHRPAVRLVVSGATPRSLDYLPCMQERKYNVQRCNQGGKQ